MTAMDAQVFWALGKDERETIGGLEHGNQDSRWLQALTGEPLPRVTLQARDKLRLVPWRVADDLLRGGGWHDRRDIAFGLYA